MQFDPIPVVRGRISAIQAPFSVNVAGKVGLPSQPTKQPDLPVARATTHPLENGVGKAQFLTLFTNMGVGSAEPDELVDSSVVSSPVAIRVGAVFVGVGFEFNAKGKGSYFAGTEEELITLVASARNQLRRDVSEEEMFALATIAQRHLSEPALVPDEGL